MSQANEISNHLLRITIHITHISLCVRFPCSLQLSIKNNLQTICSKSSIELKQGQCSPNQKLSMDVEVPYSNKSYGDKNVLVLVSMISSNGKIPAGCVQLKITENGKIIESREIIKKGVDKCPDRNASMQLSFVVQFLRVLNRNNSTNIQQIDRQSNSQVLSYNEYNKNVENVKKVNNVEGMNMRIKGNRNLSDFRENQKGLKKSGIRIDCAQQQINDHSIIQDEILLTSHKPMGLNGNTKQIERVRSELNMCRKQSQYKINSLQDKLLKYKGQIQMMLQQQIENKNRIRLYERNQKQLQNENRDNKEQILKYRNKIGLLERSLNENKMVIEGNQKVLVGVNKQLGEKREQIEEVRLMVNVLEKKLEIKQVSLNEHCNKLVEKYRESQNERLRCVKELNEMLMEYQGRQKKMQLVSKQKERDYLEEKNKVCKKVELFGVENMELKERVSQLNVVVISLQDQIKGLNMEKVRLEGQLLGVSEKYEICVNSLQSQNVTLLHQKQVLNLQEKQYEQLNVLNKKNTQLQVEYDRMKQICNKLEIKIEGIMKQNKNMQGQMKEFKNQKEKVENRVGELGREVVRLKKVVEGKDGEIEGLQVSLSNMTTKVGELRVKIQGQNLENESVLNKLSGEIIYLNKTNESLMQQLQEQNVSYMKMKELYNQQNMKIQELNEQILRLNEQVFLEQQKGRKSLEFRRENDMKIERMVSDIESRELREKGLQGQIREKVELEHVQVKMIKEKEQQLFILRSQFSSMQISLNESEQAIEVLNSQILSMTQKLSEQKEGNLSRNRVHEQTIYEKMKLIERQQQQLQQLRQKIEQYRMIVDRDQKDREQKIGQIQQLRGELGEEKLRVVRVEKKLQERQRQLQNNRREFNVYRQNNNEAIQRFMVEINKDVVNTSVSVSNQVNVITFPDYHINLLQVQSIKKKNEILMRYILRLENKDEEIKILNLEISKLKQLYKQRQEQLESQIVEIRNKMKQVQYENMNENSQLLEKMHGVEEKYTEKCLENEKLAQQLHILTQSFQELEISHSQTMTNFQENTSANQILQQKLQASIVSYNNLQSHTEHQIETIIQQNKNQIQKYKNIIKELQKKNLEFGRQVQERGRKIEEMEIKNGQLQGELERMSQKIIVGEGKIDENNAHKRQLEERIFQQQAKTAEQMNQKEKLQQQVASERLKNQQLNLQIKTLSQSLNSLQTEHSGLLFEYSTLKQVNVSQLNVSQQSILGFQQTIQKLTNSISILQEQIIKYKSQNELQMFINEQLKQSYGDLKKQMKIIEKQLEEKKVYVVKLKGELEDSKNQVILAKQDSQADKIERERIEIETLRYRETIQEMNEQVQEQRMIAQLLQQKNEEFSQLQLSYTALQRANELIKQQHSQCQLHFKKNSESHHSREEQYKNKIAELQKLLEISQQEGKRLGIDVQSLDQESGKLRNKISQLERQIGDMNIIIASKCEQLEESERASKLLLNQIKTMSEQKEKKPHNVNNTSIYQQLVKDIDGRTTRNNRGN